jgi:IS5 family transposase
MRQTSFSDAGFEKFQKKTRREKFLKEMDQVIPWQELCKTVQKHYYKDDGVGRPPIELEIMLRIHFLQHWFNLSDPAAEEAIYDSRSMREFSRVDLGEMFAPDETTICKFRHLLEKYDLGQKLFRKVNQHLYHKGFRVSTGTIVDATIIHAPSSTKNEEGERDPAMQQTKKGNQWYFGMKGHIGVDSKTKLIHSVATTSANVHDSQVVDQLLHGGETRVWGDSAYVGQAERIRSVAPKAQIFVQAKGCKNRVLTPAERLANRTKSSVRSRVEHAFGVIKCVFGFTKVRYRGLHKNHQRLLVVCALANLFRVRKKLLLMT